MTQPAAKPLARFSFTLPGFHAQLEAPPPGSPPEPQTQPGSSVQILLLALHNFSQLYYDNCVQFIVSFLLPLLERKLSEDAQSRLVPTPGTLARAAKRRICKGSGSCLTLPYANCVTLNKPHT